MARQWVLPVCLLGAIEANNKLNCYEQIRSGGLKAVLGTGALSHTCANEPHVIDFEEMLDQCREFCGSRAISLPLGTEGTGFNLEEMDQLCNGVDSLDTLLTYEPDVISKCEVAASSIDNMKFRIADLIASVEHITYLQLLYRASMLDKEAQLQQVMFSKETQEKMDLESFTKKMATLKKILGDNLAEILDAGLITVRLSDKLDDLQQKADLLSKVIARELKNLDYYIENCNQMVLGTGPSKEYLLDICSVTSNECIESQDAKHAGCCCGVIPAAGVFSISANSSSGRRLREATNIDICGEAHERSREVVEAVLEEILQTSEGRRILNEFDAAQQTKYVDFYENCGTRRLTRDVPDHGQGIMTKHVSDHDDEKFRHLQGLYLTCDPPGYPSDITEIDGNLKVAFTQMTEEALCKNVFNVTNEQLAQRCRDFCAPAAVPFLLGSLSYGFNQEQMDEICLIPDKIHYSKATIDKCHTLGNSFIKLQRKTATLVANLELLESAKLLFEAKATKSGNDLRALLIREAEGTVDNVRRSEKLAALKRLLDIGLKDFMTPNTAFREISDAAVKVKDAAVKLQLTLDEVLPGLREFMTDCNLLMTGVGSGDEYLLDLCSQSSAECLDAEEGSHVGCCCGYNPIVSLGTDALPYTIRGITAERESDFNSDKGRIRIGTRRLQSASLANEIGPGASVNICGEVTKITKSGIEQYKQDIDSIDPSLWTTALESKQAKYPMYFDRCSSIRRFQGTPTKNANEPAAAPAAVSAAVSAPVPAPTPANESPPTIARISPASASETNDPQNALLIHAVTLMATALVYSAM